MGWGIGGHTIIRINSTRNCYTILDSLFKNMWFLRGGFGVARFLPPRDLGWQEGSRLGITGSEYW